MKRVAIFMSASLRSTPSGTYTPVLVDLVNRLSSEFGVTVFTVTPPTGETEPYMCGNAEVCVVPVQYNASVFRRAAEMIRSFRKKQRENPFELVHGFWATPGGMAAVGSGRLAGIPSIVTLQGAEAASLPSLRYGNMSRASTRAVTLWTCRRAAVVTVLTRFQADAIASHGLKRPMRIIPYGAPESFFCAPLREAPAPPVQLLHVADLNAVKDQETLLFAFRTILRKIDARLTIAGRDLLNGSMERLALELGIRDRVRFLGHVNHEQLPALYFSADFLLHTSLYEAQAVVVSEAWAAGCVVCGTKVGLIADLEGICAAAVPPGNSHALAEAVVSLVDDPLRYARVRNAARLWAAEHNAAWTAAQLSTVYNELLNF